jgi:hypothetical protein
LLLELHNQSKGTVFKRCISRTDDHSIPGEELAWRGAKTQDPYQVMTLSATGDADTPAGGSVCMRCMFCQSQNDRVLCSISTTNLEVSHQTTAGRGRHDSGSLTGRRRSMERLEVFEDLESVCRRRVGRRMLVRG